MQALGRKSFASFVIRLQVVPSSQEEFHEKGVSRESPVVTEMSVVPVAGHDSMLLNLSGQETYGCGVTP